MKRQRKLIKKKRRGQKDQEEWMKEKKCEKPNEEKKLGMKQVKDKKKGK
jgi:hypothetical protein